VHVPQFLKVVGKLTLFLVAVGAYCGAFWLFYAAAERPGLSIGILAALFVAAVVFGWIRNRYRRWSKRRRRCVHGVRSGADAGCLTCVADAEKHKQQEKRIADEYMRKRQIAEAAEALLQQEVQRLTRAWLSNSESYMQMNSQEFERAIVQLFKRLGYEVTGTPFSNDRGKDAIAWKGGKKYLIECKRYAEDNDVGRRDLQIFMAAMHEEKADGGFYINTGRFARTATAYASENKIELYDRKRFPALVNEAYPIAESDQFAAVMCLECGCTQALRVSTEVTQGECPNGHVVSNKIVRDFSGAISPAKPKCVRCGSPMKIVNGRRGAFWGCSKYPRCWSRRQISNDY
jgi:HJR/Mrr/RecB family endonuclease